MADFKTQEEREIFLKKTFGIGSSPDMFVGEELVTTYTPSRMHRKHKQAFREIIQIVAKEWGYECEVESNFFAKNCVIGNPSKAKVIVGAHYDTPPKMPAVVINNQFASFFIGIPATVLTLSAGVPQLLIDLANAGVRMPDLVEYVKFSQALSITIPTALVGYMEGLFGGANDKNFNDNSSGVLGVLELMYRFRDLPQKEKDKLVFVLFDNEEKGLFGSLAYRIKHRKFIKKQHMINLDCLNGETINIYTSGKASRFVSPLQTYVTNAGMKVNKKKFSLFNMFRMSDHYAFAGAQSVTGIINDVKDVHSSLDNKIDREHLAALITGIEQGVENLALIKRNEYTKGKVNALSKSSLLRTYAELLAKTGCKPEESVMVGNDVDDDMAVEKLGMKSFLLTDCLINKADADISRWPNGGFDELERWLNQLK